jgi:hypothetical protein
LVVVVMLLLFFLVMLNTKEDGSSQCNHTNHDSNNDNNAKATLSGKGVGLDNAGIVIVTAILGNSGSNAISGGDSNSSGIGSGLSILVESGDGSLDTFVIYGGHSRVSDVVIGIEVGERGLLDGA